METTNPHKRCNKTDIKAVTKTAPKAPKRRYHLFLREQLDEITGEDQKNYQSIVSRRWKEIKENPARLSAYNDRARQMKNEIQESGDDSQNEKTLVDRPAVRLPLKAPKSLEVVDTDLDNADDEQEPVVKKPQKVPKSLEFVDTDLDDSDDEQEPVVKHLQKASKIPKFVDIDSSTDDEQETVVKNLQKAPRSLEFVDTNSSIEDEQGPTVKPLQKASKTLGLIDTGPDDKDPQETSSGQASKKALCH